MRRRWPIACRASLAENCCTLEISPVPSETVSVPLSAPWLAAAGCALLFSWLFAYKTGLVEDLSSI